jgi:hypothetical protein
LVDTRRGKDVNVGAFVDWRGDDWTEYRKPATGDARVNLWRSANRFFASGRWLCRIYEDSVKHADRDQFAMLGFTVLPGAPAFQ